MTFQWEQRPDYVNACNAQAPPGVLQVYNPPRPVGRASVTDVTDFHYGQSFWSENNLPEVMYMLWPNDDWREFKSSGRSSVPQMVDLNTGEPRVERWPRPGMRPRKLLDFPILRGIEKIGTEEHWWWFEIIRRLDPRITYFDIHMRMEYTGLRKRYTDKQFVDRVFNNRASRTMRPHWIMVNWQSKLQGTSKLETKTLARLSAAQVQNNTTRGSTPGLTDPSMPEGPNNVRVSVPEGKGIMGQILGHKRVRAGQPPPEVDVGPEARPANAGPRPLLPLPPVTGVTKPARASPRVRRAKKQRVRQARAREEQELASSFPTYQPPSLEEHYTQTATLVPSNEDEDSDLVTRRSKKQRVTQARARSSEEQEPASIFPTYQPPSLEEHYTQTATLVPSIENEDSDLVTKPANHRRMTSLPGLPPFPAFGTMTTPSGFAVPPDLLLHGIYIAPPSPPPMQAEEEEEAPLRGGGYYIRRVDDRRTASLSPSACTDCGQNDPKVRHFFGGCPSPAG